MDKLGEYNERLIYYQWINDSDWEKDLPYDNWLIMPIGHIRDYDLIKKVSNVCLDKNVIYLCALGDACEMIHDIFDVTVIDKRIEKGLSIDCPNDFDREPMTTWHNDFGEGVWFALTNAFDDYKKINSVVCLDLTECGEKDRLINMIQNIKNGWIPG